MEADDLISDKKDCFKLMQALAFFRISEKTNAHSINSSSKTLLIIKKLKFRASGAPGVVFNYIARSFSLVPAVDFVRHRKYTHTQRAELFFN